MNTFSKFGFTHRRPHLHSPPFTAQVIFIILSTTSRVYQAVVSMILAQDDGLFCSTDTIHYFNFIFR